MANTEQHETSILTKYFGRRPNQRDIIRSALIDAIDWAESLIPCQDGDDAAITREFSAKYTELLERRYS